MKAPFDLGRIHISARAIKAMQAANIPFPDLLTRHATDADIEGGRILSAYTLGGVELWIITENDRTKMLLPEDY